MLEAIGVELQHHKSRQAGEHPGIGQHVDLVRAKVQYLQVDKRSYIVHTANVVRVQEKHSHISQHAHHAHAQEAESAEVQKPLFQNALRARVLVVQFCDLDNVLFRYRSSSRHDSDSSVAKTG